MSHTIHATGIMQKCSRLNLIISLYVYLKFVISTNIKLKLFVIFILRWNKKRYNRRYKWNIYEDIHENIEEEKNLNLNDAIKMNQEYTHRRDKFMIKL